MKPLGKFDLLHNASREGSEQQREYIMQELFFKQAGDMLQNGRTFKPWLYRGQKPGLIAKFLNRMMVNNASKEAMDNGLVALEVIGRK